MLRRWWGDEDDVLGTGTTELAFLLGEPHRGSRAPLCSAPGALLGLVLVAVALTRFA